MQKIALADLPSYSEWPARLLGLVPWDIPKRTPEKIECEYEHGKYAQCLDYFLTHPGARPEDVKLFELGGSAHAPRCVSRDRRLFVGSLAEARVGFYRVIVNALGPALRKSASVVELGCGYGYNLWMLHQRFGGRHFLGGEYALKAVHLAQALYREEPAISVRRFNFYEPGDYRLLGEAPKPITVFTVHAIEQLPSAVPFLEGILRYAKNIRAVVHLEPVYEVHRGDRGDLLDLMRRRYTQANDYNRDLLTRLRQHRRIRILEVKPNVWGINPLNPATLVRWKFA